MRHIGRRKDQRPLLPLSSSVLVRSASQGLFSRAKKHERNTPQTQEILDAYRNLRTEMAASMAAKDYEEAAGFGEKIALLSKRWG